MWSYLEAILLCKPCYGLSPLSSCVCSIKYLEGGGGAMTIMTHASWNKCLKQKCT